MSINGSRSPVWFFGASRLGNQTFDLQNLRDTQPKLARYHGEPAGQLGVKRLSIIEIMNPEIVIFSAHGGNL